MLVEPPKDANIVGSCLILLCYKHNTTGTIASHKTRFITQGFSQVVGIDYNKTFTPTAKLSEIQIITEIAVRKDWEIE